MNKRKALLYRSKALRALVKALRKKYPDHKTLSEGAAIDVASIMIGIIIVGLVAGVIATTVFVIVPWAQDEAAKNQLKSLMSAEQAYAGMAATEHASGQQVGSLYTANQVHNNMNAVDPSTLAKNYGTLNDLINAELFDPAFRPDDASDIVYGEQMLSRDKSLCVVKLDAGAGYEAAIRSASGNIFVTNDGWVGPYKVPETSPVCLGRVLGDYSEYQDKVIIPPTLTPIEELNPHTPAYSETPATEDDSEVAGDDTVVTDPVFTASPTPTPTLTQPAPSTPSATPTATASSPAPQPTASSSPVPTPSASPTPTKPPAVTPDQAPEPPAANKDPKTKNFMFCHNGQMHSNNFNGMVNGHHGHPEDIMPPIPFKNYVGWNWNAQTAKIYYNNCKPL